MTVRHAFSFFFACVLLFVASRAHAAYAPPARTGLVTDPAKKLTADQAAAISAKLAAYQSCSTNEVAVFIPTSLEGNTIQDVAYAAFNGWKLGLATKDNGVLLVVAPAERTAFIATGKGVGGEIPDVTAFHILRDHVTPNMKVDKVFAAVDEGTSAIGKELGGCEMKSATPSPPPSSPPAMSDGAKGVARVLFGIGIFAVAFAFFTGLRGRTVPKLVLSSIVTAAFEAATFRWDPIVVGFVFVIPLFVAMMIAWARRNPSGVGGDASAFDAGGASGGGHSGGSSGGGGGSTGGGGASDSW